jgi:hypothetical protein
MARRQSTASRCRERRHAVAPVRPGPNNARHAPQNPPDLCCCPLAREAAAIARPERARFRNTPSACGLLDLFRFRLAAVYDAFGWAAMYAVVFLLFLVGVRLERRRPL